MQKIFLCCAFLTILTGCTKKIDNKHDAPMRNKNEHAPVLRLFRAQIEGVECALCAQDVVGMVKKLKGVTDADFVMTGTDYEQGHVRFYYDVSACNFDVRVFDAALAQAGFELTSLYGTFYLEPFSADGKKYVALSSEVAMPFSYSNNIELLKKMIRTQPEKLFAQGSIKRNAQEGAYYFTLLGEG